MDPNTRLPHTIINFVMRNLAGVLLYLISRQSVKASKDHNCSHAKRIREDTAFYRDWLLPKIRYCDYICWIIYLKFLSLFVEPIVTFEDGNNPSLKV